MANLADTPHAISWLAGGIGDGIRSAVSPGGLALTVAAASASGLPVVLVTTHPDDVAGRMRGKGIGRLFRRDPRVAKVVTLYGDETREFLDLIGIDERLNIADPALLHRIMEHTQEYNRRAEQGSRWNLPTDPYPPGVYAPPLYESYRDRVLEWAAGRPVAALAPFGRGPFTAQNWSDLGSHLAERGWAVVVVGGGDHDRGIGHSRPVFFALDLLRTRYAHSVLHYGQDDDLFLSIAAADVARACITSDTWTCLGFTLWDRFHALLPSVYPVGGFYKSRDQYVHAITSQHNPGPNRYHLDGEATVASLLEWCDSLPEGEDDLKRGSSLIKEWNDGQAHSPIDRRPATDGRGQHEARASHSWESTPEVRRRRVLPRVL